MKNYFLISNFVVKKLFKINQKIDLLPCLSFKFFRTLYIKYKNLKDIRHSQVNT